MKKHSRRDFFRRAAQVLPIVALSVIPMVSAFTTTTTDCKDGCTNDCIGSCESSAKGRDTITV